MSVTIRRKRDGLYMTINHGNGRIIGFTGHREPAKIETREKAVTLIRVDMGANLDDYEIEETKTK